MNWHVDETSAARYAARRLDAASVASVESHLLVCGPCRAAIGEEIDDALVDSVWLSVTDVLDQPASGASERALRWVGCSDSTARIVTATTRARLSFAVAVAFSLLLAVIAAQSPDGRFFGLYLIIAPIGALVATAGAFGRWSDPAYPLVTTVPTSALRILLIRVIASVVPALALTMLSVPWVVDRGWLAIAWLLPSLALAAAALALSSWIDIERAAIGVGLAWLLPPMVLRLPLPRVLEMFHRPAQLLSVLVFVAAAAIILIRRDMFDQRET